MAAPIIDSVSPSSVTLNPGEFTDVVVTAHDPDSANGAGTIEVTDSQGNVRPVIVGLVVDDPLTFGAGSTNLPGVTVQKIAETPTSATYRFTAA